MNFRKHGALLFVVALLGLGAAPLQAGPSTPPAAPSMGEFPVHPFAREIKAFVAAVREAEKETDPLRRCLAYPDPPGSHWTHEAVVAYCHYRYQPIITFAEVKDLIEHGKAAELDRRMDAALNAQFTQPDARGRLDQSFLMDFGDGSMATRYLLDAWKRQSPDSAFAYAASGYAYVNMAHEQRGGAFAPDTPGEKFDAMHRLLLRADADLRRAISLNPRITPVYRAMIHAAGLEFGRAYAQQAIDQAAKVDPANWTIYRERIWLAEPQWMGSLDAMQGVADSAMQHVKQNPLLWMEKTAVAQYQANVNNCDCAPPPEAENFPAAFDELVSMEVFQAAAKRAQEQNAIAESVVYLSEAIRFMDAPQFPSTALLRQRRAPQLVIVDEPQMALDEANKLVASAPGDAGGYAARGLVYLHRGNNSRAEQDLETALTLKSDDDLVLSTLVSIYTANREWDKAWDVDNRMLQKSPDNQEVWIFRAIIQEQQPRAGLEDTYRYCLARFSDDPSMELQFKQMREALDRASKAGTAAPVQGR
ncbi:DUF4034 domain-containing protein [Dyella choica]|uniref:DUF4034 domain-containing protein n=1 Tax=Dyella choica TaxID=1927959 RepID=A0A3S0WXS7_9GAMM|nr:DUF4034 domain-containing protein [Dyella choica]RUL78333.1 DUF4034 domain-containing protein [Dyella choica]